jgi:hypothetical protein
MLLVGERVEHARALVSEGGEHACLVRDQRVKRRGVGGATSLVTGRPSSVHFFQPPLSTATSSKPNARSIHQIRAAHILTKRS